MVQVVAAIIERAGAILVGQRTAQQSHPLKWEFPGGKVEPGEDPVAALAREVREELGCELAVGRIHEVVFHKYPDFDLVMLVYAGEIAAGEPRADHFERLEVRHAAVGDVHRVSMTSEFQCAADRFHRACSFVDRLL